MNPESQVETDKIQHLSLAVQGMHCTNCVGRVEHALLRVAGVRRATVNLLHERADIDFSPAETSSQKLLEAVVQSGYRASAWRGIGGQMRRERIHDIRLILCLLLSLPLLLSMLVHAQGLDSRFMLSPWVALGLASVVQFWGGWPFYREAFNTIKTKAMTMGTSVAIGSSLAYGISVWHVVTAAPVMLSFEASALIITVVLLGRRLEDRLKRRTMAAIHQLVSLQPQQVRKRGNNGTESMVPLPEIAMGDEIVVWMGERVPLDGEIVDGVGTFDYSLLTGETLPRVLAKSETVTAGACCLNGSVRLRVTNHAGQTMLDRMADMVAVAQASQAPIQRLADTVAGCFIMIVLGFALATFGFWSFHGDWAMAQKTTIAVLLLACPCALGLAVPMVISVAVGQASKHGILLRDATALERASKVTTVIFDKTGTLTNATPELAEAVTFGIHSSDQIIAIAAALNQKVHHPVASALRQIIAKRELPLVLPQILGEPKITFGRGVEGELADGTRVICGNLQFMSEHKIKLDEAAVTAAGFEHRGRMLCWVASLKPQAKLMGLMAFRDHIRPEAQKAVSQLLHQNYQLAVVSGDNRSATLSVAKRLGIGQMLGEALPQDKMLEIQKRQKWGEIVAVVGDGMNDAPALALADLGIAVQGGVEAADAAAPIRLLRDDLRLIPAIFELSKAARRVMSINLGWAIMFNIVGLPLAALGQVPPWLAAASMSLSSLIVIGHSLTLKFWRPHYE
jgi:P-type Cu+ transporter